MGLEKRCGEESERRRGREGPKERVTKGVGKLSGMRLPSLGGRRYVYSSPKGVGGDVAMRGGSYMGRGAKGAAHLERRDLKMRMS